MEQTPREGPKNSSWLSSQTPPDETATMGKCPATPLVRISDIEDE